MPLKEYLTLFHSFLPLPGPLLPSFPCSSFSPLSFHPLLPFLLFHFSSSFFLLHLLSFLLPLFSVSSIPFSVSFFLFFFLFCLLCSPFLPPSNPSSYSFSSPHPPHFFPPCTLLFSLPLYPPMAVNHPRQPQSYTEKIFSLWTVSPRIAVGAE